MKLLNIIKILITNKMLITIFLFALFLFYFNKNKENLFNKIKIIKHFKTPKKKIKV